MELQTIYNQCAAHLLRQAKASYDDVGEACLYRGPDGMKCAVGYFIRDDQYHENLEGYDAKDEELYGPLASYLGKAPSPGQSALLFDLQRAHDHYLKCGLDYWASRMIEIAKQYGLIVPKQVSALAALNYGGYHAHSI